MRDYVIPVTAILREGLNYDIEVEFTPTTWECKGEALFTLPFTIDGAIRVLDGEAGGNAANTIMPHIKVGWSDGAGGTALDLAKPDPTTYTVSQPNYDYGLFTRSLADQNVYSIGWYADIPEDEIIGARVYEANGTTRGALISAGTIRSSGAGSRWHDIPVTAELEAWQDYDLEIEINGVNSFDYWLDFTGMPYDAGGLMRVYDGEQGGDAANALVLHMRVNSCVTGATGTGIDDDPVQPPRFTLGAPYPNPVHGEAVIPFSLDRTEAISIAVYDVLGRRVATLVDGATNPAGPATARLDTSRLPAGVYFVKMSALSSGKSVSRKITVVR